MLANRRKRETVSFVKFSSLFFSSFFFSFFASYCSFFYSPPCPQNHFLPPLYRFITYPQNLVSLL